MLDNKLPERQLTEPTSERTIYGEEISLTESITSNTTLLQHYLNGSNLKTITYYRGSVAKTKINLLYIEDLVDIKTLEEVKEKLKHLEVKYLINHQVLVEELTAKGSVLFPTVKLTTRFDIIATDLLQGRVVLLVDHNPYAIVAPVSFWSFFQTQDEYSSSYGRLTNRLMRLFGLVLSVLLPAVYIAISKFHMDEIKSESVKNLFHDKELLSPFWEMVFILLVLRVATDASLHVYKTLNIVIALVSTLIIGQFSVMSHIVNPFALVVTGLTQLCVYLVLIKGIIPLATTTRWLFMVAAAFFGYKGIAITFALFFIWGVCLKPFGIPYFAPIIPLRPKELKDTLWRGNLKKIVNSKHKFR